MTYLSQDYPEGMKLQFKATTNLMVFHRIISLRPSVPEKPGYVGIHKDHQRPTPDPA